MCFVTSLCQKTWRLFISPFLGTWPLKVVFSHWTVNLTGPKPREYGGCGTGSNYQPLETIVSLVSALYIYIYIYIYIYMGGGGRILSCLSDSAQPAECLLLGRHVQSPVLGPKIRPVFNFTLACSLCHKINNT